MSQSNSRRSTADAAIPTVASLNPRAKLITEEEDAELKALIERYEQLLCD